MGRSKEMGKLVSELTMKELRRERERCKRMVAIYGNNPAAKLLRKRLHEIERRFELESK